MLQVLSLRGLIEAIAAELTERLRMAKQATGEGRSSRAGGDGWIGVGWGAVDGGRRERGLGGARAGWGDEDGAGVGAGGAGRGRREGGCGYAEGGVSGTGDCDGGLGVMDYAG